MVTAGMRQGKHVAGQGRHAAEHRAFTPSYLLLAASLRLLWPPRSALCTGEKGMGKSGKPLHFKNSIFHRVIPQFM